MMSILSDKVATFDARVPEWAVADALNAPDAKQQRVEQPLNVQDVQTVLMANGDWGTVVIGATTAGPLQRDCVLLRDICTLRTTVNQGALLGSLLAAVERLLVGGVLSTESKTLLASQSQRYPSWSEANGLPSVTARDVGLARGAKAGGDSITGGR